MGEDGSKRENNYDLLRVISGLAVISLHISASYIGAITDVTWFGEIYNKNVGITCLYNGLSMFPVPVFVMLSGAFALADESNRIFAHYYRKVFNSIGIPMIVASLIYILYSIFENFCSYGMEGSIVSYVVEPIKLAIKGRPFYHLWYLYMMIGVFALTPVIIWLKCILGRVFKKVVIFFFPVAMLCMWTSKHDLSWDIGCSFYFLGYYMLGYVIRKHFFDKKNNYNALIVIFAGIFAGMVMACYRYYQFMLGIDSDLPYQFLEMCASLCIFVGFSMLKLEKTFYWLAKYMFEVYLFHAGIWDILKRSITIKMDSRIVIPSSILIVFLLSLSIAIVYKRCWCILDNKYKISCRMIRAIQKRKF